MNILFLTFGNILNFYLQTLFSFQSLFVFHKDLKVHIFTDNPKMFEKINKYVIIHPIDLNELEKDIYAGDIRYFFRIKLKLIERFIENNPGEPIMFFDSDTFIYKPINQLFYYLQNNKAIMHEPENLFSEPYTKTGRHTWKQIKNKEIAGFKIDNKTMGWNSGVIGIPAKNNKIAVGKALSLCDELIKIVDRRTYVEQNAYSIAMNSMYGIEKANDCIGHYWGNKDEWSNLINDFYLDSYIQGKDFNDEIESLTNFDFGVIPYGKRQNNTRIRLNNFINKKYKDRDLKYISETETKKG